MRQIKQLLLLLMLVPLATFAESGYVGDYIDFKVPASTDSRHPDIYTADWTLNSGQTNCVTLTNNGIYGASVHIDSYFTGSIRVVCRYTLYKQGKLSEGTVNKTAYFDITCNVVTLTPQPSSMTLKVGEKDYITYTSSPSGKSPTVTYSSSNTSVTTVDYFGKVTAIAKGYATITLSNSMGPDAKVSVNVTGSEDDNVKVSNITINSPSAMIVGETQTLTATVYPSNATNKSVKWASDNSNVATINEATGLVTAKSVGTATVTCSATDGSGVKTTCNITVNGSPMPSLSLSANPSGGSVESGTKVYLTASANGSTVSGADIYYTANGSTPSKSSTKYTSSGITINSATTIKAIAYKDGYETSDVGSWSYTIATKPKLTLSASPSGGNVESGTIVYLTASADGLPIADANIYYTTNGSTPSKSSTKYTSSGIPVTETCTLKAIAYKDEYETSDIVTEQYVVRKVNKIISIAGNQWASFVVFEDNSMWAFGYNNWGMFGDGGINTSAKYPVKIMDEVTAVSTLGGFGAHAIILKSDGSAWTTGNNEFYQIGDGTKTNRSTPFKIMDDVVSIAAGGIHSLIVKSDGSLWGWGSADLGEGASTPRSSPVKITDGVASVFAGDSHSMIIKKDGSLWACGYNKNGQLGDGTTSNRSTFVKIMDDVATASAGDGHSMIIKKDGSLWACGYNKYGQLGDGTNVDRYSPVKIMDGVASVSAGGSHTLIVKTDGSLWACGSNEYGQLGDGSITSRNYPIKIMSEILSDVTLSAAGDAHSLIAKSDGSLWTCGYNHWGQLGDGTTTNSSFPVTVISPEPQSIIISPTSKSINLGETFVLTYSLYPSYAKTSVTVHIDDHVEITTYGTENIDVKGIKIGTSEVTVETANGLKATCQVTIENPIGDQLADGTLFVEKTVEDVELTFKVISASDKTCQVGDGERRSVNDSPTSITIPESVRGYKLIGIGDKAFQSSNRIVKISIPPSVLFIGERAFQACSKLSSIVLPEGMETIGVNAFRNCTDLNTIYLPSSLKSIGDYAFYHDINVNAIYSYIQHPFAITNTTFSSDPMINATLWIPNNTKELYRTTTGWSEFQNIVEMVPPTIEIPISSSSYATFYDSQSAYTLPSDLSAQVVTNVSNSKLTYKTIADGSVSGVIPAGTAVMLVSDSKKSGTYTLEATESSASYSGTNLLRGSDEAQMTTGDGYHYKLSYGQTGTSWSDVFGWYWGADNGGSFMTEGHKAWLVVPKSAATTRGFTVDGETTGIATIEQMEKEPVYYDLQGRRISKPIVKGVYIKNGKKVIVK